MPPLKIIAGSPDRPLVIGSVSIPCYVLSDETRVLSQNGLSEAVGSSRGTTRSGSDSQCAQLPRFARAESLNPFLTNDLTAVLNSPIPFQSTTGGRVAYGYHATVLPDLCEAVLRARDAGALRSSQMDMVQRCETLIRGMARVGIIALVDEATGYQRSREERALADILEKHIAREFRPWTKTFPIEFYEALFRLKGWDADPVSERPSVVGHYTNAIVYARLAPGVLDELRKLNPVTNQETGARAQRHHQWFTSDYGHPKLAAHLESVTALMKTSKSWADFKTALKIAYPTIDESLSLNFTEIDDATEDDRDL